MAMKKKLIVLGGILFLVALIAVVFGFVFLGSIVKAGVEQVGPMVTKTPVKLGGASVSVFNGSGELKSFELGNPEGYKTPNAIKAGTVSVAVSPGSIFSDKVVVKSVRVLEPEITFETGLKENNLSAILANVQSVAGSKDSAQKTTGSSKKLEVDEFVIAGGRIHLSATMLGGKTATIPLPEIHLSNLGQGPEGITPAELVEKVMSKVTSETVKAVAENGAALAREGADAAKKAAGEGIKSVEKMGSGIGDLLKKKK